MGKVNPKKMLRSLTSKLGFAPPADSTKLRSDGFYTAKGIDSLFPRTRPEVDGDECLHDCENCTVAYPNKFSIDEEDALYGQINGFDRHLIVATGKTDWVRDVSEEKDSVMEAVGKHMDKVDGGSLMLSASNIPTMDPHSDPYGADTPTTVLLMPSFTYVDNVTPKHVPDLINSVINTAPMNTTPLSPENPNGRPGDASNSTNNGQTPATVPAVALPTPPTNLPASLSLRNCPHKYIILICSQATRDARCGQTAPLLRKELERQLRPLGLYRDLDDERPGGVGIYFISHVGGHKYSANMLIYRKAEPQAQTVQEQINGGAREDGAEEAAQCIWLARIRPEDIENLVRFTVLQGKVVKPERQLRGGFDRQRGIVSW